MYRKGIPVTKIAAIENVAETTVRYHLQIAARAEPGIRDEHKAALPPEPQRTPEAGLRNLADVIAFHESEGRLPVTHGKTARERALGAWLVHRRREAAQGTLSPTYREALAVIPGWDKSSTRKPTTRHAGSSGLRNCRKSGPTAATGRGIRKRTTPTNARWGYGCMGSGSTTAPAGWALPRRKC